MSQKSRHYRQWHNHPYHKHVHIGLLVINISLIAGLVGLQFIGILRVHAATTVWNFGTSGDYSVSDASSVEVTSNTARLKTREYASDANTQALYHLNESSGTSVADSSSNNNTGTATAPTWGAGNLNNAVTLDGSTSQIRAADSASLSFSQHNTIEGWTKFNSAFSTNSHNAQQSIADKGNYQLYYDNDTGKVSYELARNDTTNWTRQGGVEQINSSWDGTGIARVTDIEKIGSDIYASLGISQNDGEIWRYNGTVWIKIGGDGVNSSWSDAESVTEMTSRGSTLYVGLGTDVAGDGQVWSWNGTTWTKIGGDGVNSSWTSVFETIDALYDDGTTLYAGIGNSTAGEGEVWSWNGTAWTKIGGDGVNSSWNTNYETVHSLVKRGTVLYAGLGDSQGDAEVWSFNGTTWTQIGGDGVNTSWAAGVFERVNSLVDDGTTLYAGIGTTANDAEVWSWNGTAWTMIGGDSINSGWTAGYEIVTSLAISGSTLYAGLGIGDGDGEAWSWNGTAWTKIGGDGVNSGFSGSDYVYSLYVDGSTLYAGTQDGGIGELWSWNGTAWTQFGGDYMNGGWGGNQVDRINVFDTANNKLYAGSGAFTAGDGLVFEFNGSTWTPIGGNGNKGSWANDTVEMVTSLTDLGGNLYAGLGTSAGDADVWRYNGTTWTQIGGDGMNSSWAASTYEEVRALGVNNGILYAGIGTGTGDGEVWSWNGTAWTKIGGDGTNSSWTSTTVQRLMSFNGVLFAGTGATNGDAEIWSWNGTAWTKIGGDGVNSSWNTNFETVESSAVYDGMLYVGLGAQGTDAEVWGWNGTTWTKVGSNVNNSWSGNYDVVRGLTVYNGELYAGLGFSVSEAEVWKYNGTTWSKVGGDDINGSWNAPNDYETVGDLAVYQGKLYVGLGDTPANNAEVWSYGNNAVLSSAATSQDTNWHHIAATYDGATMKLYIDGTLNASQTVSLSIPDGSSPLVIGSGIGSTQAGQSNGRFAGSLDEVRISNTARSSFTTTPYAASAQTVAPTSAVLTSGVSAWDGFSTSETANGGAITYRLSNNNGSTWQYWNGSNWVTSSGTGQANAVAVVNSNIPTFSLSTGGLSWQAILTGNGNQRVILNSVTLTYTADAIAPTNPTSATGLNQSGGATSLTSGNWYNYATPEFSWSGAADSGGSGVQGYFVYFGTDNTADPVTTSGVLESSGSAPHFQAGTSASVAGQLTTGQTYYLRVKTRDNAQNVSATAFSAFTYKFDSTAPTNPGFVSVSPSGYSATNSFTFVWPSSGGGIASDAHSGVAGYQYKTGAASGSFSTYSSTTTQTTAALADVAYQEGANTFYLRTIDTAGNVSEPVSATFYYNATAPSAPQSLQANPSSSTTNSFGFSWSAPATYQGAANELTYLYSINTLPTSATVTSNGNSTSLAAGPYATQQGDNTFYVVAKDAAGNVNYSSYVSATFSATTSAPGQPLSLAVIDSSNRTTSDYRLSLTWTAPASGGTVQNYKVYRSIDNTSFAEVGTTTTTGFIDADLTNSATYYYKIRAFDSAGSASSYSATVNRKPTGKFTEPPKLINDPKISVGATIATITWTTDRESDSFAEYGPTNTYGANNGQREETTDHKVKISGLTPETVYHFRVQSLDPGESREYSSDAGKSNDFTFTTVAAPSLSNVAFNDITTQSTILSFETSKATVSTIDYGTSVSYGSVIADESTSGTTKHTIRLKDLLDGTSYQVRISVLDPDGNVILSPGHSFTTVAKPKISNLRFEEVKDQPQTTVKVTWDTNVPTTGAVVYTSDKGDKKDVGSSEFKTHHEFQVTSLKDQSNYIFKAVSRDAFGNEAVSDENTLATPQDTRPPAINNLVIENRASGSGQAQRSQLVVSWETDEAATSQIEYGPGIGSDAYATLTREDTVYTTNHVVIVSELEPSKVYHLRVLSRDQAGNTASSPDTTAITGKLQRSVIDIIITSLQRTLGFIGHNPLFQR